MINILESNTPVEVVKADTCKSVSAFIRKDASSGVVIYKDENTLPLDSHDENARDTLTRVIINTNVLDLDSIEVYTSKVIKGFLVSGYKATFIKDNNILLLLNKYNVIAVFILPILKDSLVSKAIKEGSKDVYITGINTIINDAESPEQTLSKDGTIPEFYHTEDRVVKRDTKLLLDAIDYSHIFNDDDRARIKRANRLAASLEMYIMGIGGKVSTSRPSKRTDRRKVFSNDAPDIYINSNDGADGKFSRKANIIIDCSGSMMDVFEYAKLLVDTLSLLPNIKGKVILTSWRGSIDFKLPMEHNIIANFICRSGSEGLATTMIKYESDIKEADTTLVFTDGNLVDGYPSQELLDVYEDSLVGVMLGKSFDRNEAEASLSRFFRRFIISADPIDVIDLIMTSK